jgi:hypothetical protein
MSSVSLLPLVNLLLPRAELNLRLIS